MSTPTLIPSAGLPVPGLGGAPRRTASPKLRRWLTSSAALVLLGLLGLLSWTSLQVTPDVVRAQRVLTQYVAAWNAGDADGVAALTCTDRRAAEPVGTIALRRLVRFDDAHAVVASQLDLSGLAAAVTVELRASGWAGWCLDGVS